MKIAHFGTFDVENYGDLMFPLILERRLGDICDDFTHVSPAGGPPVWEDCVTSTSSERFLNSAPEVDGVVIGGGHIVRASRTPMKSYDAGGFSAHFAYPSLWLGAAYAAARANLPLCWNAPGVTEHLPQIASRLARWTASVSDYVSVRDEESRRLLREAGLEQQVEVSPDTVIEVSRLWSGAEISAAYEEAFSHRGRRAPERTIAFHLALRWATEDAEVIAARLDRISREFDAVPVLVAIGPCHGDSGLQRRVGERMSTEPLIVDHPRSLREVAACIARSEAYVGSSMHGMITACSFGKRGMLVASGEVAKFEGFLERFHLSDWMSGSWQEAERRAGEFASAPASIWEGVLESAMPDLDRHWDRVREALTSEAPDKQEALDRLHGIGEEYAGKDSIFQGIVIENLHSAASRRNPAPRELEQKIDRQEQEIQLLISWIDRLEHGLSALLNSRQWKAGRAVGELHRRALRRPRTPMASNTMLNVLREFRSWQRKRDGSASEGGNSGDRPARHSGPAEAGNPVRETLAVYSKKVSRLARKPRKSKKRLAREIRHRIGPAPELTVSPRVSIIVLNRNGLGHLRKLFSGLADRTDYPDFEVIVVDNGSSDGSLEFLSTFDQSHFPLRVASNQENATFSEANNQGAELASGDLLLFLNNDIEPFESGWLTEMIGCMKSREAGVVGARLLYLQEPEIPAESGYAVQHRGVSFRNGIRFAQHYNLGMGEDALDERLGVEDSRPAVTAACLLIQRDVFDSIGGFTLGYRYGSEDVDLCLKARSAGSEVFCEGRAVLLHDESSSQRREGSEVTRKNRAANWQLFRERWGPELQRRFVMDRLSASGFWTEERAHVAIPVMSNDLDDGYEDYYTAHEIGDALQALGWRVSYVESEKDQRWQWRPLPEGVDYLLVLMDRYDISGAPEGVTTIAWVKDWTERWISHPWFADYDVVLASSQTSKEIIEEQGGKNVDLIFPIATNPRRFSRSEPEPAYESDYVFTGNFWGEKRVVDSLDVASGETFLIFGKGWEKVPEAARYSRGPAPHDELPKVYSSAKLVIDDTASPTLPYGAVNSRVFDALATGTLVITNCEAGVRELFDEEFPAYSDAASLRTELDRLLGDDEYRHELASRYQKMVLEEHTYDHRARQLTDVLHRKAQSLSFCIKIGPRNWERARLWGDLYFARAMKKQLERRGHPCLIQVFEEWDDPEGMKYDVAIHLKGLTSYTTKSGQLNVLWNISHPEKLTVEECEKYDLVFTAAERWARRLNEETETPVFFLEQATDPEVFHPEYDGDYHHDLVFVGNSRGIHRKIVRDLLPANGGALGYDLALWGKGWENIIDNDYISGIHLPNDEVKKAYSSASIVLNDHWDDMREHGFISNRIYDALASGAFVISDDLLEIRERFGDAVVTYESPQELKSLIDHYLASPREREEKAQRGRELVLEHHTFEQRIEDLLGRVLQVSGERAEHVLES